MVPPVRATVNASARIALSFSGYAAASDETKEPSAPRPPARLEWVPRSWVHLY